METILVCDDDRKTVEMVKAYLLKEGYLVETASDGEECLAKLKGQDFSLIILDVILPKLDGFEVCKRIRANQNTPIILLTARSDEQDRVAGLKLGADDYVVKPFSPRELVARVKVQLRHYRRDADRESGMLQCPELLIYIDERRVLVADEEVQLTPKEFDLLVCMAQHPGLVYSRAMLYELVWGNDSCCDARTVDVLVTRLRNKLEQKSSFRYISTMWGLGYRFEAVRKQA